MAADCVTLGLTPLPSVTATLIVILGLYNHNNDRYSDLFATIVSHIVRKSQINSIGATAVGFS